MMVYAKKNLDESHLCTVPPSSKIPYERVDKPG